MPVGNFFEQHMARRLATGATGETNLHTILWQNLSETASFGSSQDTLLYFAVVVVVVLGLSNYFVVSLSQSLSPF